MTERQRPHNRPPSPERIQYIEGLVGLQARLLIGGEAFNPNNTDLPSVAKESLGNFTNRNYSPFNTASTRERKNYWQNQENNDFSQQKQRWSKELIDLFETNKNFFKNNQKGKQWSSLYSKLAVDTQSFTQQNANQLYDKYFAGEKKDSNIKQFVSEVVATYKNPEGQIDYALLKRDLEGIQWLANIFGEISSEIVAQLIDAEVQLQTQPQKLVDAANNTQNNILRVNNLNHKERELLSFLSGAQITDGPKQVEAEWKYERLGEIRIFPNTFSYLEQAKLLKQKLPQKYGQISDEEVARQMETEAGELQKSLIDYGLSQKELHNLTLGFIEKEVLGHYRDFIKREYGITLPFSEKINVLPIRGMMSELYNPHGNTLAFVQGLSPYIFLDMNAIRNAAKQFSHKEDWRELSKRQLGNLMKRLLREIKPHEYTHLMSDIAYWALRPADSNEPNEILLARLGKLGLLVVKPKGLYESPEFEERGRGLMEAVTVQLTMQWAASENHTIDIPAYAAERSILDKIVKMLQHEDGITEKDSFKQFVLGYFKPEGYYDLIKLVDGHKKDQAGQFITKRPHYLSLIYGLMEYEANKHGGHISPHGYPLTLGFIQKNLTQAQKDEITNNLNRIKLSEKIKDQLRGQI